MESPARRNDGVSLAGERREREAILPGRGGTRNSARAGRLLRLSATFSTWLRRDRRRVSTGFGSLRQICGELGGEVASGTSVSSKTRCHPELKGSAAEIPGLRKSRRPGQPQWVWCRRESVGQMA